jgi:hypothetical protein
VVFVFWATFHALFIDQKPRRNPEVYRRERRHRQAEKTAQRYQRLPPMVRVINEERRWRKARRSAIAAVRWALVAKDFSQDEIAGAVVKVLHENKELVFDHDALHRACLSVLMAATNQ